MAIGPIKRLHKARHVLEMDYFHAGLHEHSVTAAHHSVFSIRTRIRGGIFTTMPIPHGMYIEVPGGVFEQFPAGIDIVPPFIKSSPGWYYFNRLPMVRMKQAEQDFIDAQKVIEAMMASNMNRMSPEKIKEDIIEALDIIKAGRTRIATTHEDSKLIADNKQVI